MRTFGWIEDPRDDRDADHGIRHDELELSLLECLPDASRRPGPARHGKQLAIVFAIDREPMPLCRFASIRLAVTRCRHETASRLETRFPEARGQNFVISDVGDTARGLPGL